MNTEEITFENNIIKSPDLNYPWNVKSLGDLLFKQLHLHKDGIQFIERDSDQTETSAQFLQRCIRTSIVLQQKGIREGDIICICSTNHRDTYVPFIAAQFLGAVSCGIHPNLTISDSAHLLQLVKPKIVFIDENCEDFIKNCLGKAKLDTEYLKFGSEFNEFVQPQLDEDNFKPVEIQNGKQTAVIVFSSGSTGLPKGICLSHYSFLYNMYLRSSMIKRFIKINLNNNTKSVIPLFSSLYWLSGVITIFFSLFYGNTVLIYNNTNSDINTILKDIEKYKIANAFFSPIQVIQLCKNKKTDINLTSLKSIVIGGSPISKEYILELRKICEGAIIYQGYSQSEAAAVTTIFEPLSPEHRRILYEKPDSCGLPMHGIWYKVVDPDTEEILGPNKRGELRIKSIYIMNGYYEMDSSEAFDEDGYFKTGDIVYYDDDFCFYIVDRLKELLKYRNWQIAPNLIENHLVQHPGIEQAVVIGKPHKEDGDHPLAVVVLRNNFNISEEEIEKYIEERVHDTQKLRGGVVFMKSLPLTVTGKINRKAVKDEVLKNILNN